MCALIRFELLKLWRQKKSWMAILNIFILNALFSLGFYLLLHKHGHDRHHIAKDHLYGEFIHALSYTQMILAPSVMLLFPMMLSIMAAYQLAGEFELGSLRMMLMRPIGRGQVLVAKFIALSAYSGVMLLVLGTLSYTVSALCFGASGAVFIPGPMFGLDDVPFIMLTAAEAQHKLLLTYVLAWPMLMSVSSMALMFAVITRHFTSSAIVTSTVYFCSYIVGAVPFLSAIHPYLPTRHWPFWNLALLHDIPWDQVASHASWTFGYTAAFLALATAAFTMRDV